MSPKNVFVVNPRSAGGATQRRWPSAHRKLCEVFGDIDVRFTDGPNAATRLTREAIDAGATLVVSVGGDGTHNEVVNGFFRDGKVINDDATFGLIPAGTGGDFRRSFGWSDKANDAIERLRGGERKRIDVGRATVTLEGGTTTVRHFINVASFGISGEVDKHTNSASKLLGGKLSFAIASLKALSTYQDRPVTLAIDGGPSQELSVTTVAICNGQYFGGGMWVSPTAKVDDGLFDLTIWSGFTFKDFVLRQGHLYRGTHVSLPETTTAKGRSVRAESAATVLIDLDGEQTGRLPATFELLPKAIWIRV